MAFQLIPFFEEPAYEVVLVEPVRRCPVRSNWPLMHQLAQQLNRLTEDSEVCVKDDRFGVCIDVAGYEPKDLNVSVKDNMLHVSGSQEQKSEDGSRFMSRSFERSYTLPEHVQLDQMKSLVTSNGRVLRIEAPIERPQIEAAEPNRTEEGREAVAESEPEREPAKEVPIEIQRLTSQEVRQG